MSKIPDLPPPSYEDSFQDTEKRLSIGINPTSTSIQHGNVTYPDENNPDYNYETDLINRIKNTKQEVICTGKHNWIAQVTISNGTLFTHSYYSDKVRYYDLKGWQATKHGRDYNGKTASGNFFGSKMRTAYTDHTRINTPEFLSKFNWADNSAIIENKDLTEKFAEFIPTDPFQKYGPTLDKGKWYSLAYTKNLSMLIMDENFKLQQTIPLNQNNHTIHSLKLNKSSEKVLIMYSKYITCMLGSHLKTNYNNYEGKYNFFEWLNNEDSFICTNVQADGNSYLDLVNTGAGSTQAISTSSLFVDSKRATTLAYDPIDNFVAWGVDSRTGGPIKLLKVSPNQENEQNRIQHKLDINVHSKNVKTLDFNKDPVQRLLASGSKDKFLKVTDLNTNKIVVVFDSEHEKKLVEVKFLSRKAPNLIAARDFKGNVSIFDIRNWGRRGNDKIFTFDKETFNVGYKSYGGIDFCDELDILAVGHENRLRIVDFSGF